MNLTLPRASFRGRAAGSGSPSHRRRRPSGKILAAALLATVLAAAILHLPGADAGERLADLSRSVLGDQRTLQVEGWYFSARDQVSRLRYRVFGAPENPFPDGVHTITQPILVGAPDDGVSAWDDILQWPAPEVAPPKPAPMVLPETRPLRANPAPGEGVWTTEGLPHTSPEDTLMAKTFIRPDASRDANVGMLLVDKRRVRLHITGGTQDPGGDLGVKGPGTIPGADRGGLLVAWNGGFRGPHGGFGMYADGKTYRPLRDGLATVVVLKDGSVLMGEWGPNFRFARDDMTAARQNAVLLVSGCEVSRRTNEGNNTWGYVNVNDTATFITWRSAIGLTKDGDLLVAAGYNLSAATLAKALWAAGACTAMQLDINVSYVLVSLYFPQADGALEARKFMSAMALDPRKFFRTQERDFMYLTLDETAYVP